MFGPVRRYGPVVLIPAAWIAAWAAYAGALSADGLLIAHLVMLGFITGFLVTGWTGMDIGALRAWRAVLLAGWVVTAAGVAGFVGPLSGAVPLAVSLIGWMLLPAAGLVATARELSAAAVVYGGGAVVSVAGAAVFVWVSTTGRGPPVGVAFGLVAVGQTAGIVDAARR